MVRRTLALLLCFLLPAWSGAVAAPVDYRVGAENVGVGFSIRYLAMAHATGRFTDLAGTYRFDAETGTLDAIDVSIGTASIDTGSPRRDADLRKPGFFWVDQYPTMRFHSLRAVRTGPHAGRIEGELTLRGITRPIVLMLALADGNATATTRIRRSDFGLRDGLIGFFIADNVDIRIDIRQLPVP